MPERNIYIDVTQLVHWDKNLAGIPRVMHELAIRFHDKADDVQFVSWVKEVKAYCLIDYDQSVLRRDNGITYIQEITDDSQLVASPADSGSEPHDPPKSSSAKNFKQLVKKVIDKSGRINPSLPQKIYSAASRHKANSYIQVQLSQGDTVFIGWGEWWDENFLTMLEDSHQRGAKISTIIHDVGPMITPHLSGHSSDSLADYCRRIVPLCSVVMVNSQYTKKTLTAWMLEQSLTVPDISVFTLGDDFSYNEPITPGDPAFVASGLQGSGDFIMTVGTVELKKNHIFLYYVYYLAHERGINLPPLVIVGRKGWGSETNIDLMMSDPILKEKFVFMFDTSDEELAWLYDNARFSVFPSFYEGWGIPVAESLFHRVPVISSHATSLAEVGGDLVSRFSPASTEECLSLMIKMMDEQYYTEQRRLVGEYSPVTWDMTYQQTIEALREGELI